MDILVVDDEPAALRLTCYVLEQAGFTARRAPDGQRALMELRKQEPAMVLLDIGMPATDGFEICRSIRKASHVPVIFVTAHNQLQDRLLGLKVGGDDYLSKPYEPEELIARIKAVLRRTQQMGKLSLGSMTLDPLNQTLTIDNGRRCELTPIEFRLLYCLMQNVGQVVTTEQILRQVWSYQHDIERNVVAVYIRKLRQKIGAVSTRPSHITTVASIGYRFEV
jgi:DNA-binding response OmpR family regulator